MTHWIRWAVALALSLAGPLAAQQPKPEVVAEIKAAWAAGEKAAVPGPAEIKLLDQATLKLPGDELFIPAAEANRIMTALGNQSSPSRYGLIINRDPDSPWMVDLDWIKEGYIRDGDAKEWNADELLESLKEGTEAGNKDREARGIPALDVVGWVEPPAYDAAAHRLVWSMSLRNRGDAANAPQTINYNSYALGREGYFSLDLITGSDSIQTDKAVARELLGSLTYVPGKRYEDFDGSTDKVAAYGLAALIGGVVAKKVGLLALLGIFLVKMWKLAAVAVIAGIAMVRRFLRGRKATADGEAASDVSAEGPSDPPPETPADDKREGEG